MKILTFDIEEWFHILDHDSTKSAAVWHNYESRIEANCERILNFLASSNQKATFFCLGWVARKYPQIIRQIDTAGHEIGTHSDLHQLAYLQSPQEFSQDLHSSINALEDITSKKVKSYRAPGFSLQMANKWLFEELIKQGIEIDCSVFPAKRAHGGFSEFSYARPIKVKVNGMEIKEFPINTYKFLGQDIIFSGGGYFRLLPYQLIKYFSKRSKYIMTYFHPRDFDPDQPMIKDLSLLRKFKSYYGLRTSSIKLQNFVRDFDFIDLHTANKTIDWDKADVVNL